MQLCSCFIRLGGNLGNTVRRVNVSPAEVQVLRSIHGDDAVVGITDRSTGKSDNKAEFERLCDRYGKARVASLYPGIMPSLPQTFRDIGVEVLGADGEPVDDTTENPVATPRQAKGARGKVGRPPGKNARFNLEKEMAKKDGVDEPAADPVQEPEPAV